MQPADSVKQSLQGRQSCLVTLTKAIFNYEDTRVDGYPAVLYHSAQILLCLIAPFALSFAEECQILLYYRGDFSPTNKEDDGDPNKGDRSLSDQEIEEHLTKEEGKEYQALSRQASPSTFPSIFNHPFPIAKLMETIYLLKSPELPLEIWHELYTRLREIDYKNKMCILHLLQEPKSMACWVRNRVLPY